MKERSAEARAPLVQAKRFGASLDFPCNLIY
jgi:hypothetical protein